MEVCLLGLVFSDRSICLGRRVGHRKRGSAISGGGRGGMYAANELLVVPVLVAAGRRLGEGATMRRSDGWLCALRLEIRVGGEAVSRVERQVELSWLHAAALP